MKTFILYDKMTEYMYNLAVCENDILKDNFTIFDLITWIFEHNKEAYKAEFWKNTFNMTDAELKKYRIFEDLEK